jgi:feruloyl esterase
LRKPIKRQLLFAICFILGVTLPLCAQSPDCAKLTARHFVNTRITSAQGVAAGPLAMPGEGLIPARSVVLPGFCRVKGEISPHIGFELWMPAQNWNGRLVALGSGGFGGYIGIADLASMLKDGYAVTANDTGHTGQGYAWMHDPIARRAWGHSATHDVIGPVKQIVRAYYRTAPAYSYFDGCSTGGAQAMEEAEFYPGDFNGIVAGSPGMYYSHLMLSFLWGLKSATEHAVLSPQKLQLLNRAVMKQCATPAELKDGFLQNPLTCHFHPEELRCKGGDTNHCLTRQEVKTAELMYEGPRDPRTGAQIYPGFVPGSEASPEFTGRLADAYGWSLIEGPLARQYAIPLLKNMVFGKDWNWKTFDWDRDVARVDRAVHADIDAVNPDLRAFQAHGGKLIMTQGWGDPFNAQTLPIEYRVQVIAVFAAHEGRRQAQRTVNGFFRLFMAPGMSHCVGGPGPSQTDALAAVRAWVETGKAPTRLIAKKISFSGEPPAPPMSRPLCPYPQIADWTGKGPRNEASNFICATPNNSSHLP